MNKWDVECATNDSPASRSFDNVKLQNMMRVIDHEPQWWFLLEEDGSLFLDANCSYGFVGYDFLLQLNPEELKAYAHEGRVFISRLATEIQNSVPIAKVSTSRFKGRDLSRTCSDKVTEAVKSWRANA
jgi:hypothetical protein